MALFITIPMVIGFIADIIIGDPEWLPHPVRLIGIIIEQGEKIVRKILPETPRGQFAGGMLLTIIVLMISFMIPILILWTALKIHFLLAVIVEAIMCYQILAVKSLKCESMKVYEGLLEEDLEKARHQVSMIVGRDTKNLTDEGIVRAAVETVAENTSDGIVAPMIFMAIGGAPLGFLYKAVNTLDSMIGYKSDRYIYFGRFAAKLDDVFNFIPSRIAALFMIASSFLLRLDYKNAWKIFKRDRFNHNSPNSGQTESVAAGALCVELGGDGWYFGKLYEKKTIGDAARNIQKEDIIIVNRLLYFTAFVTLFLYLIGAVMLWLI